MPTPRELGYSFPPEWHRQEATWFSWPRPEGISFPGRYESIPPALSAIMRHIVGRQRVRINVPDASWADRVRQDLRANGCPTEPVQFFHIPTNESWCRDHGPAFLLNDSGSVAIVDWGFNAWGGKYPPYDDDDRVPTRVAEALGIEPVFHPGIVMEGGAVDFNGEGVVLTTESCLLNPNRNPGLSKSDIEQYLKDYYGQRKVCWLGDGIAGDDTDGHVDDLARFVNPRTIITTLEHDPADENYDVLQENLRRCRTLTDADGRPFDVVTIPMPGRVEIEGQRLPATYVNFLFVNDALLVPTYRHPTNDRLALDTLARLLPKHQIIGIDCTDLIWGLGAIHCLTQQQPATG